MQKKKKISLENLEIQSFVTCLSAEEKRKMKNPYNSKELLNEANSGCSLCSVTPTCCEME